MSAMNKLQEKIKEHEEDKLISGRNQIRGIEFATEEILKMIDV